MPANAVIRHLKDAIPKVKKVLVLGAGLGSMVNIIRKKGCDPYFTLVENDKVVLQWALEFLPEGGSAKIEPVCMDAMAFMNRNTTLYDLIFIDIFSSREVPRFVTTEAFLLQCRDSLAQNGHVAFNYMVNDPGDWVQVQQVFTAVFVHHKILDLGVNKVFIGWWAISADI